MRSPFAVRHRVMCARFARRVRTHGGRQGTKKNSGVSGAGKRERAREREREGGKERAGEPGGG